MSSSSFQVIAILTGKAGTERELRELLVPAVREFRHEPGCAGYVLMEDQQHAGRFVTYESWKSRADLERHMASPAMKALEPLLKPLLAAPLEQQFLTPLIDL